MKPGVALASSLGGCVAGYGIAAALGVPTYPEMMQYADHDLAYRLFPVTAVILAMAVGAYVLRSRVFFWTSLAAALASLLAPESNPVRARYATLEGAAMASLHQTFLHSATLASMFAITGGWIASLASSKLLPGITGRRLPHSAGQSGRHDDHGVDPAGRNHLSSES